MRKVKFEVFIGCLMYCMNNGLRPTFFEKLIQLIKNTLPHETDFQIRKNATINTDDNIELIKEICNYCEEEAIYDKLGKYHDFYYKLKQCCK